MLRISDLDTLPPEVTEPADAAKAYHSGMDAATLIGVALVAAEHYFVLIDRPIMFPPDHLALGKVGVFLFLIISGYRAGESKRPPGNWFWRRLVRIYPAYWIALCLAFLAAGVTGTKSFSGWQVLAQFAGIGYFTHPNQLILEATWFLSPLLACYGTTYLARLTGLAPLLSLGAVAVCVWLLRYDYYAWTCLPYLAYAIGFGIAGVIPAQFQSPALMGAGLAVLSVTPMRPHLPKLGIACLIMAAGLAWRGPIPGARSLAERSYEFYLVHGLAFSGALGYLRLDPVLGGVAAFVGSLILTEALFRAVAALNFLGRNLRSP